jgi:uncharacterized protein (TIGR02246 family)
MMRVRIAKEKPMKLFSLGLAVILVASPAYAGEAMTVAQDLASK